MVIIDYQAQRYKKNRKKMQFVLNFFVTSQRNIKHFTS